MSSKDGLGQFVFELMRDAGTIFASKYLVIIACIGMERARRCVMDVLYIEVTDAGVRLSPSPVSESPYNGVRLHLY